MTELAEKVNVHESYPKQIIAKYDYIVEEKRSEYKSNTYTITELESKSDIYNDLNMNVEKLNTIEYFAQNEDADIQSAASYLDYSHSYIAKVVKDTQNIIQKRANELNNTVNIQTNGNSSWDELTPREKHTLLSLLNTDNIERALENIDFDVGSNYVKNIQNKNEQKIEDVNKVAELEQFVKNLKNVAYLEYENSNNQF